MANIIKEDIAGLHVLSGSLQLWLFDPRPMVEVAAAGDTFADFGNTLLELVCDRLPKPGSLTNNNTKQQGRHKQGQGISTIKRY